VNRLNNNPIHLLTKAESHTYEQVYQSESGTLFQGDCLPFMADIAANSIDVIFADPPFNLGKDYGNGISDELQQSEYLNWSRQWLTECIRLLKPGGSLFVFNLPKWLIEYGAFLNQNNMLFRHWIACRMPKAFPRGKRLSPAHYGLLYYTKGEPATFNKVYIPIPQCRHCGGDIHDYGGHRDKLNPQGLNLMDVIEQETTVWDMSDQYTNPLDDVWEDIPPVRHSQHKVRGANELAPILLERIIALASNVGDIILDPFGGSGTTYYAAEKLGRRWLGIELGDTSPSIRRLTDYFNGNVVEWESARHSADNSSSVKKSRKKVTLPHTSVPQVIQLTTWDG